MIGRDTIGLSAFPAAPRLGALAGTCRFAVLRAVEVVEAWGARIEQRRQLASLDARMLRDIGCSESDVVRETAKPFWRP